MKKMETPRTRLYLNLASAFGLSVFATPVLADVCTPASSADGSIKCTETIYYTGYDLSQYDRVVIETTTAGKTAPLGGFGMYVAGNLNLGQAAVTVNTSGSAADAIRTQGGGKITFSDNLQVNTTGSSADGINVTETSNNSLVTIGNNATINATSGVGVRSNTAKDAGATNRIIIGNDLRVVTNGSGSNALDSVGYGVYAGIRSWVASGQLGSADVVIGNNSEITTTGSAAHAVYANKGGLIRLGDNAKIETAKTNAYDLYAETGTAGGSDKGSRIDLLGGVSVLAPEGGTAIYAKGAGSQIASYNSALGQNTSGKFTVAGAIKAESSGVVDLKMTDGSLFDGNTEAYSGSAKAGTVNLGVSGTTSRWYMSADSNLTTLDLQGGAQVFVGGRSATIADATDARTLTVENLSGNGVFHMRTDMGNQLGDLVRVTGTTSGNHEARFNDRLSGGATGEEELLVVSFEGAATTDNQAKFTSTGASVGAYEYALSQKNDGNWYLSPKIEEGGGNGGGTTEPPVPPSPPSINKVAESSVNILNVNYLLNYAETQTLLQRMGELRQTPGAKGDVWSRVYGGHMNKFDGVRLSGFDMDYRGVQIGIDTRLDTQSSGEVYVGVMAGTAKATPNYSVGSGDTNSYHAGVYGTYKTQSGFYVNGIAKYVRTNNRFNTVTSGGYAVKGNGNTNGFTIGVEAGKRFYVAKSAQQGWYLEPQAQLTFARQGSVTVKSSNGLRTDLESFNSTLGRVSIIAGYSIDNGENPIDVYVKTGYVREFSGKTGYTFNGKIHEGYDFGGGWWENGIGVNMQIAQKHNVYLDATYAKGGSFNHSQVNLGYRYSF